MSRENNDSLIFLLSTTAMLVAEYYLGSYLWSSHPPHSFGGGILFLIKFSLASTFVAPLVWFGAMCILHKILD